MKKNLEKYTELNTSLEHYKKGENFHNNEESKHFFNYYNYSDIKDDHPLNTYACIKTSTIVNIAEVLQNKIHVSSKEFYIVSINQILEEIVIDINTMIETFSTDACIYGPVYVIIYQAPYLRLNGREIVARPDSINSLSSGYNNYDQDTAVGIRKSFVKLHIVYPNYYVDSNGIQKYTDDTGFKYFKRYMKNDANISRDKNCFLNCKSTSLYSCGCLNHNDTNDLNGYKSTCSINIDGTGLYDFGMIYQLNSMNVMFKNKIHYN